MLLAPAPEYNGTKNIQVEPLGNDVHVWLLGQDEVSSQSAQESWSALLSADELERANRFHFARHAREYIGNRARLRILLGQYLDTDPASLVFSYNEFGKPALAGVLENISFNLSHTDGLATLAVSSQGRIGVDIEKMVLLEDWLDLARSYFSKTEVEELGRMDPIEGQASFYRCWTRKEAFVKALGDGLSRPLSDFTVSSAARSAKLLSCSWDSSAPASWQLFPLEVGTGYAAALAYERDFSPLFTSPKVFSWSLFL